MRPYTRFDYSSMYEDGRGVEKNTTEAIKWYKLAVEQGLEEAKQSLTRCAMLKQFDALLMPVSNTYLAETVKFIRDSAEQGDPRAQYNLGLMYAQGEGVRQSFDMALKWFYLAANNGVPEAQYNLGVMYGDGTGVKQDDYEACKWYQMAVEQGLAEAQLNLGYMYFDGRGVPQDYEIAAKWWLQAAEQGKAKAQFNIGLLCDWGTGLRKNRESAAEWFYKAGLSYLKEGDQSKALRCIEKIKKLRAFLLMPVSNTYLADKLLEAVSSNENAD